MQIIQKITNQVLQNRIINSLCGNYNYQAEIPDPKDPEGGKIMPNPETKIQFADRIVNEWIKNHLRDWESKELDATIKSQKEQLQTDINNLSL